MNRRSFFNRFVVGVASAIGLSAKSVGSTTEAIDFDGPIVSTTPIFGRLYVATEHQLWEVQEESGQHKLIFHGCKRFPEHPKVEYFGHCEICDKEATGGFDFMRSMTYTLSPPYRRCFLCTDCRETVLDTVTETIKQGRVNLGKV